MDRQSGYAGPEIVGMDLHRCRSVLVRTTGSGERLGRTRIDNSPAALKAEIAKAGPAPRVVLEAAYGWYWAADAVAEAGAEVHLAHPLGVKMLALDDRGFARNDGAVGAPRRGQPAVAVHRRG
jgi:hypothetical protein